MSLATAILYKKKGVLMVGKIRTQIIDKNNKLTSVYKNIETPQKKTRIPASQVDAELAKARTYDDVMAVVNNITDRRILNRLARSSGPIVNAVQGSGVLTGEELNKLYEEGTLVTWSAVSAPTAGDMALEHLEEMAFGEGASRLIVLGIAENYWMPEDLLKKLTKDDSKSVSSTAEEALRRKYTHNFRSRMAEEGTLYTQLEAKYDTENYDVPVEVRQKIEALLGNISMDADFYRKQAGLDGPTNSERYDEVSALLSPHTTRSIENYYLTSTLFSTAGLRHEVMPLHANG